MRRKPQPTEGTLDNPDVKKKRSLWPFKFTLEDNRWYVRKATKRRKDLSKEEDALF